MVRIYDKGVFGGVDKIINIPFPNCFSIPWASLMVQNSHVLHSPIFPFVLADLIPA